jgi:excisionase family DNA binding protein
MTQEETKLLSEQLADKINFTTKEVLTAQETARYMGISMSYLYKLTMRKQIPHYKPMGKVCYFKRNEVEEWLLSNRISTEQEINNTAL